MVVTQQHPAAEAKEAQASKITRERFTHMSGLLQVQLREQLTPLTLNPHRILVRLVRPVITVGGASLSFILFSFFTVRLKSKVGRRPHSIEHRLAEDPCLRRHCQGRSRARARNYHLDPRPIGPYANSARGRLLLLSGLDGE